MNERLLIIGIGNSSRSDDALGWRFVDEISTHSSRIEVQYRYQLQVEDAELVSHYDAVLFADATRNRLPRGFFLSRCDPVATLSSFSTHRVDPGAVMWLCRELFGHAPRSYVMAIEGKSWELQEGLSSDALENLVNAVEFFKECGLMPEFNEVSQVSLAAE